MGYGHTTRTVFQLLICSFKAHWNVFDLRLIFCSISDMFTCKKWNSFMRIAESISFHHGPTLKTLAEFWSRLKTHVGNLHLTRWSGWRHLFKSVTVYWTFVDELFMEFCVLYLFRCNCICQFNVCTHIVLWQEWICGLQQSSIYWFRLTFLVTDNRMESGTRSAKASISVDIFNVICYINSVDMHSVFMHTCNQTKKFTPDWTASSTTQFLQNTAP